jgi:hypothetical protein
MHPHDLWHAPLQLIAQEAGTLHRGEADIRDEDIDVVQHGDGCTELVWVNHTLIRNLQTIARILRGEDDEPTTT